MICIEAQLQSIEIVVVGQILPLNASLTMYYLGLQGNNKPDLIPFLKRLHAIQKLEVLFLMQLHS